VGHITREEKYECVILNEAKMWFNMGVGSVYWVFFKGLYVESWDLYR
jgi:hypothetical protein